MKRKPITPREMEAAYRLCLERERDRERKAKLTKQGAFESAILHLDFEKEEAREREASTSWLSDRGRGARQIRRAADPQPQKPTRAQLINRAKQLVMRNAKDCSVVFWLILKNRSNRKESICQLERITDAKRTKSSSSKKGPKKPSTGTR